MTQYAKLNEIGQLEYAPRDFRGVSNWINDTIAVQAAGYYPVIPSDCPADGKNYRPEYILRGGNIVTAWVELPEPNYQELRRQAHRPLAEQLDMIYWDKVNGTNDWEIYVAEIKSAYPKPVEALTQTER